MRRRWVRSIAAAALAIASLSCRGELETPLGSPFVLHPGESAHVTDTELHVLFVRVRSDSRCPRGVQCITAGEAMVTISVHRDRDYDTFDLHLPGGTEPDTLGTVKVGEHRVRVEALEPYPVAGVTPDPASYSLTLVVEP